MKLTALLLFLATTVCGISQNFLPQDKDVEILDEGERNPFGRRGPDPARVVIEDSETEESRLQTAYSRMEVSGFAEGAYGRSVLLGRHKIFPGDILPPILSRQTEVLRVEEIHPERIELIFVDRQSRPTPRKITIRYSMEPKVRHMLGSQVPLNRALAVEMLGQFPVPQSEESEETGEDSAGSPESSEPAEGD
jgi:hypothetical protein